MEAIVYNPLDSHYPSVEVLFSTIMLVMLGAIAWPLHADLAARQDAAVAMASTAIGEMVFTALKNTRLERGTMRAASLAPSPAAASAIATQTIAIREDVTAFASRFAA